MKAICLFVSLICAMPQLLRADGPGPEVKLSKPFTEPVDGNTRLLMMKNGNTLLFHFMPKGGIKVMVYDSNGKLKKDNVIKGKEWDTDELDKTLLCGLYEINGDAVIFLNQSVHKKPSLFRILIDAEKGTVKQENLLLELKKEGMFSRMGVMEIGREFPSFNIAKDPESDYYAISAYHKLSNNKNEQMEVIHYDPLHKEINRAFYDITDEHYKHVIGLAMYVQRDQFVFVFSGEYSSIGALKKDIRYTISRLDKGKTKFSGHAIDYMDGFLKLEAAIQYDTDARTVQLLTIAVVDGKVGGDKRSYASMLHFIDPEQLVVKHKHFLENTYASEYATAHLGYKKGGYTGMPQGFVINDDHTITVMSEDISIAVSQNSARTKLGDIGIARYDRLGQEIGGFAVAKDQVLVGVMYPLFQYRKNHGAWNFRNGNVLFSGISSNNSFFSYDYIKHDGAEYVFFNDYIQNTEGKETSRSKKSMHFVRATNAICYMKKNDQMEKFYLFGDTGDTGITRFIHLEGIAKSPDQKTIAAMMVENNKGNKKAYIAWIKF